MIKYYDASARNYAIENYQHDIKVDKKYFMIHQYAEKFGIVLQKKNKKHD